MDALPTREERLEQLDSYNRPAENTPAAEAPQPTTESHLISDLPEELRKQLVSGSRRMERELVLQILATNELGWLDTDSVIIGLYRRKQTSMERVRCISNLRALCKIGYAEKREGSKGDWRITASGLSTLKSE